VCVLQCRARVVGNLLDRVALLHPTSHMLSLRRAADPAPVRSGVDGAGAHRAVDRALADDASADIDHRSLTGGDALDRLIDTDHERATVEAGAGRYGVAVSAHLHLARETGCGIRGGSPRPAVSGACELSDRERFARTDDDLVGL